MTTELCTYTRNACDIARRTGVERIELCAAPLEGGTTPSAGLIRYARSLPGLRLSVMIRPRGGDFLYTDDEVALMAEEIRLAREYGADGVVFGLLTPAGEVDETRTAQLVLDAEGMEVKFHPPAPGGGVGGPPPPGAGGAPPPPGAGRPPRPRGWR